jgi:saccharopine dehydrogenase (NAD+, L-lysine-forming)
MEIKKIWLRAETKKFEYRRALSPDTVKKLVNNGFEIVAEDSDQSIINASEYEQAGATIKDAMSWKNAPEDYLIAGLKELPHEMDEYGHHHLYFAHVYKEQDGWKNHLQKYHKGGGKIIDLEYMVDAVGRRVAAFGYWAGYVGAALAYYFYSDQSESMVNDLKEKRFFINRDEMKSFMNERIKSKPAKALVIGAGGRSGAGAKDFFEENQVSVDGWDREETEGRGPIEEILAYNVLVNCVLSNGEAKPFLTRETIQKERNLRTISDVSCDPDSDCNMLPIYEQATKIDAPLNRLIDDPVLDLIAIDNLPSILPRESTYDFSAQLEPYLLNLNLKEGAWNSSLSVFHEKMLLAK